MAIPRASSPPEPLLWLNDSRGVYIPRDFAASFRDRAKSVSGVSEAEWQILESGPDEIAYWDVWADVCDNAAITDELGRHFHIYQDCGCWLIPDGMEWSDDTDWFIWPERQ